jgi:hypothetical protein
LSIARGVLKCGQYFSIPSLSLALVGRGRRKKERKKERKIEHVAKGERGRGREEE